MKTFSVEAALRHRFRQPEWAILFEVRNQTGYGRVTRTADAIAMSLYPSRGLEIVGIGWAAATMRKELERLASNAVNVATEIKRVLGEDAA